MFHFIAQNVVVKHGKFQRKKHQRLQNTKNPVASPPIKLKISFGKKKASSRIELSPPR